MECVDTPSGPAALVARSRQTFNKFNLSVVNVSSETTSSLMCWVAGSSPVPAPSNMSPSAAMPRKQTLLTTICLRKAMGGRDHQPRG